jgi:hypothetical protein
MRHRHTRLKATIALLLANKHRRVSLPELQKVAGAQHGARLKEARDQGFIIDNELERTSGPNPGTFIAGTPFALNLAKLRLSSQNCLLKGTATMADPVRVFPVSAGLLAHKQRMGSAVWEFLWLLDECTSDEAQLDGTFLGIVRFGNPICAAEVARDLAEHTETGKANLRRLAESGYVIREPVIAAGHIYKIVNSKKWLMPV